MENQGLSPMNSGKQIKLIVCNYVASNRITLTDQAGLPLRIKPDYCEGWSRIIMMDQTGLIDRLSRIISTD